MLVCRTACMSFIRQAACDFQDVTLLRKNASDKLGLTLCYDNHGCSDDNESLTDVYVSEVSLSTIHKRM